MTVDSIEDPWMKRLQRQTRFRLGSMFSLAGLTRSVPSDGSFGVEYYQMSK